MGLDQLHGIGTEAAMKYLLEGDRMVAVCSVHVATFLFSPNELLIPFESRRFPVDLPQDICYELVDDPLLRSWLVSRSAPLTLHSQLDAIALCIRVHVTAELRDGDITYFKLKWRSRPTPYTIHDLAEYLQKVCDEHKVA